MIMPYSIALLLLFLPTVRTDHFFDFYVQRTQNQPVSGGFTYEYKKDNSAVYCSGCTNGDFKVGGKIVIKDEQEK